MLPILLAIAIIVILFIIVIAGRSDEFKVARETKISAPPEKIFPHVNELRKWEAWNPWGKIDPDMKLTYDGPASGVGAVHAWAGNRKVGEGRMTITGSRANESVQFKLEFFKPMAGICTAAFTFKPDGSQTAVTWGMEGKNNFMAKVFSLFVSCDTMIGGQFAKGLADLKSVVETAPKT